MSSPMFPVPQDAQNAGASDSKWFAGLAMQAIIVNLQAVPQTESQREEISLWAWRMGQDMAAAQQRLNADPQHN